MKNKKKKITGAVSVSYYSANEAVCNCGGVWGIVNQNKKDYYPHMNLLCFWKSSSLNLTPNKK